MAKYKKENFVQLSRKLFNNEKFQKLPYQSRWIYTVLVEYEHKYTGETVDFFFHSDKDCAKDCGMKITNFKKYKKILVDSELIEYWLLHFTNDENDKKSERKISAYRLLE